jgi:hypothetical protein
MRYDRTMWCSSRGCRVVAIAMVVACGPSVPAIDDGTSDTADRDPTSEGEPSVPPADPTTTVGSSTAAPGDEDTTTAGSSSGGDIMSSTGSDATGDGCPETIACGNSIYGCGDGLDNDGDGSIDLEDPDCVGPCDDDEAAFWPSLPGDEWSCLTDCFFDGNGGQGDDMCLHDLRCDPLEPVRQCEYEPHPQCVPRFQSPTPECIAFCEPFVPNGCDCFGCCAFQTPDGPKNLFVDSQGCSAGDLSACTECTPVETCGNPCEADACEICIGQTAPPRGCDAAGCVGGTACTSHCDCEPGGACVTGCCIPPPPG